MSEYDWRDGAFSYRTASEPERYRTVAKIEGVRFVSRETYNYADALERIASVERDADVYVVAVRDDAATSGSTR